MATPPSWIACLANEFAAQIHPMDVLSPLGCHFYRNRALDQWEITLFASRTEIVGGPLDGQTRVCPFQLDLVHLQSIFDEVLHVQWQSQPFGDDDDLGPHLAIEGIYDAHAVWVRILAEPPEHFDSGRCANTYGNSIEDTW